MNRRKFLSSLGAVPLWPMSSQSVFTRPSSHDAAIRGFDFSSLAGPLTPNDQFYTRDHFSPPALPDQDWRLQVSGEVRMPFTIRYAEILRLPARDLSVTLECAGNGVGQGGVSTANWRGIALAPLLEHAVLLPGVRQIRLVGADRGKVSPSSDAVYFSRSIPLHKALHPDTLLAYRMNGAPLPYEHGHPLRVIVPGWYGMDSVKWLVQIEALTHSDMSYFMTQAYIATRLQTIGSEQQPITRMHVKSQIARPRDGEVIPRGPYRIRGAAWAGERKVAKVEVSTDGGGTWATASLEAEAGSYAWTLWQYRWDAGTPGVYTLVVRASDDQGATQPNSRDTLRLDSYEQNSYHSVRCQVAGTENSTHGEEGKAFEPAASALGLPHW